MGKTWVYCVHPVAQGIRAFQHLRCAQGSLHEAVKGVTGYWLPTSPTHLAEKGFHCVLFINSPCPSLPGSHGGERRLNFSWGM